MSENMDLADKAIREIIEERKEKICLLDRILIAKQIFKDIEKETEYAMELSEYAQGVLNVKKKWCE